MSEGRADIAAAARRWIGTPYLHQASLLHIGCDCLGLVRGVWRDVVGEEPERPPPYAAAWAVALDGEHLLDGLTRHFQPVVRHNFLPGDLLVFRFRNHLPAAHLAIATTPTQMVHAQSGACVAEVSLGAPWRKRLAAVFTFPGVTD